MIMIACTWARKLASEQVSEFAGECGIVRTGACGTVRSGDH